MFMSSYFRSSNYLGVKAPRAVVIRTRTEREFASLGLSLRDLGFWMEDFHITHS